MRKLYVFLFTLFASIGFTKAQVNYSFTAAAGTYTAISGTTITLTDLDDGYANAIPIGFTINYNGTNYTTLGASSNGYVAFATLSSSAFTNSLTSGTPRPILAPLWDDVALPTAGDLQYATTGVAGSRVFTIQWSNVLWQYDAASPVLSFQIKLYETTNVIEFVYSNLGGATSFPGASIGITATATGSGNFLSLNGTGAAPTASSTIETTNLTTPPASGQIYRFTPLACSSPSAPTSSAITTTTATISWTASGTATSYDWEIRTSGACGSGSPVQSGNTASTSVNLTSLTPGTTYTYCIRSVCAGPTTSGFISSTFATLCNSVPLNVTEGFNTTGLAVFPACWTQQYVTGTANIQFQTASGQPTTTPFEGTRYVWWNSYSIGGGNVTRLVSVPVITTGTIDVDVEFYWFNENSPTYNSGAYLNEGVQVQYSTNGTTWTSAGSFIPRQDATLPSGTGQWKIKTISLPPGAGNQAIVYVGFLFTSQFGDNCSMDMVTIKPSPPCATPSTISVGSITSTSASVSFVSSGTNFIVEYGLSGFTPGTAGTAGVGGTVVTGIASPIALSGLTANTTYDVYVRRVCGGPTYSPNSALTTFTTQCTATGIPYLEDFNSATIPNLPACTAVQDLNGATTWTTVAAPTGYSGNTLRYSYSSSVAADDWFYTRGLNLVAGSSYKLTFKYGNNSTFYNERLEVKYGTGTTAASMTNALLNFANINDNTPHTVSATIIPASTGVYYIGFHSYSLANQFYLYLDDVSVDLSPAVDAGPTALVIPAISCSNSTPVTILATVKNYGSATLNLVTNPVSVTVNITGAGTGTLTGTLNTGTLAVGATTNVTLTPTFSFTNGGTYNFAVTASATGDGDASNNTYTTSLTVNATPVPVITPANPRICAGSIQQLTTNSVSSPVTVSSGPISVNVPDASPVGATHTLNVTGIPAGSTVTAISITFNMTHTFDGDMIFNLKAPNGNVLNLMNQLGGAGDNFVNTVISSTGAVSVTTATSPFTGTYLPQGASAITASAGITSNVTTYPGLYSVPNGAWVLSMRDAAGGDLGILTDWTISISFTPPTTIWFPRVGLFTDAGATVPYTGTNLSTVYAKPTTSTTYNAFVTTPAGCSGTGSVTVLVDQVPNPTIAPPSATICRNDIQPLTVTSNNTAAVSKTSSGVISVTVPDNTPAGITNTLAVSGIPAGAVITNIDVSFNMTHTFDGDMIFNIQAPNGNILNLINGRGGSGDNFTNTTIGSLAGLPAVSTGVAPFRGNFAPDGASGVGPTGYLSNVILFAGLFSTPNGNWTLAMRDVAGGDIGLLSSWSITIYYSIADNTTWSPITGLYTDPGATTAYTGTNLATVYAKPLTTTTYTVNASTTAGCSGTKNVVITVNQPPSISSQPAPQPVCLGGTATFSVTASGAGLTYQWRKNSVNLANGGNISGVNTPTLVINNVAAGDVACYDVVITGTCNPPVTSNQGCLTLGPPNITGQPQAQTTCSGNSVSFSVTATGTGLSYQWRRNGVNLLTDGVHIIGATSSTLTIINIVAGDAGTYDVVVTNSCGQSSTSASAVLTFSLADRWLGTSNSDWNNPLNWCNGVPTNTMDVVILSGTPFSPVIAITAEVRNLQIDAGATLVVTSSGWLNIYGNTLTVNGTFNTSAGTLGFRNTANLNVPGMTVNNVVMNGTGGITMTGNLNITTALTLTIGNITLGNNNLVMTGGSLGSVASHIVTSGTGVVTNNSIGLPTVVFPVGPTATSYNPLQIAGGQGLNYSVRVATGVPGTLLNGARAINRTWTITASGAPAADVSLTFGYADADANASANGASNMEIGYYNGTTWVTTTPAGGVTPTGTAAARQVYTTSRNFGTMVVANIGGINTPTATPNLDADIYNVKLLPNIVNQQAILRVMSRRAMNVEWSITDLQGRVVMKLNHPILAGQNDISLKLGHLANGTYQVIGYTSKGTTNVIKFVRL